MDKIKNKIEFYIKKYCTFAVQINVVFSMVLVLRKFDTFNTNRVFGTRRNAG
jgi:hypothetical protein